MSTAVDRTRINTVVRPDIGGVNSILIDDDVEHIYAVRQDSMSACAPLINGLQRDGITVDESAVQVAYRSFRKKILTNMSTCSPYTTVRLHTFKARTLHQQLYKAAARLVENKSCIKLSLDFLIEGDSRLEISRMMSIGGKGRLGYTCRPGTSSMDVQIDNIKHLVEQHSAKGQPVPIVLLEDNVRARSLSMVRLAKDLLVPITESGKAHIAGVATCFMVADNHEAEQALEMPVSPVVSYELVSSLLSVENIAERLDVITVRDFALPLDGYAVLLKDGQVGRMPGFLPLFDSSKLINIDPAKTEEFSDAVLTANEEFIKSTEKVIGASVLLKHIHPYVALTLLQIIPTLTLNNSVAELLAYFRTDYQHIRDGILELEAQQSAPQMSQGIYQQPSISELMLIQNRQERVFK